jgi:hypothetical protein
MTVYNPGTSPGAVPGTSWELKTPAITRRTFTIAAGTAAVAAATAYAMTSTGARTAPQSAAASFGAVRIIRAGRSPRFTAAGHPVLSRPPGAADFSRMANVAAVSNAGTVPRTGAHGHGAPSGGPVNETWGDVIVIEAEVTNTGPAPKLFSPGQLRLKVGPNGPTVTPRDASRGPGTIPAGVSEPVWISYLAPSEATEFSIDFTDPQQDTRLALSIPHLRQGQATAAGYQDH